jgi:proteic killer suppression protein
MIKDFRHKGIERYFKSGPKAGIQAKHEKRLRLQLGRLDAASGPQDMGLPGWKLHALKGDLKGHWAVWVDENWRLTFAFEGEDAILVDYQDYHGS